MWEGIGKNECVCVGGKDITIRAAIPVAVGYLTMKRPEETRACI